MRGTTTAEARRASAASSPAARKKDRIARALVSGCRSRHILVHRPGNDVNSLAQKFGRRELMVMSQPRREPRSWFGDRVLAYLFVGFAMACAGPNPGASSGVGGSPAEGAAGSPVTSGGSGPAGTAGTSISGAGAASPAGTGGSALAGAGGTPTGTAGGADGVAAISTAKLQFDGSLALRRMRR